MSYMPLTHSHSSLYNCAMKQDLDFALQGHFQKRFRAQLPLNDCGERNRAQRKHRDQVVTVIHSIGHSTDSKLQDGISNLPLESVVLDVGFHFDDGRAVLGRILRLHTSRQKYVVNDPLAGLSSYTRSQTMAGQWLRWRLAESLMGYLPGVCRSFEGGSANWIVLGGLIPP
jgi:hypothetical protein